MINCQNSKCCLCPNFISSTEINQNGTILNITIPSTTQIYDGIQLCIALAQNIPNLTGVPSISIKIGGTSYPVIETQCKSVHNMYSDQLKQCPCGGIANRQMLSVKYSFDLKMFVYDGNRRLPKTHSNSVAQASSFSVPMSLETETEEIKSNSKK